MEKIFVNGLIAKKNPKAPEWVLCGLSVKVDEFIEFINQHKDQSGWLNIDILMSKNKGKPYAQLNTYQPETKSSHVETEVSEDDVPF